MALTAPKAPDSAGAGSAGAGSAGAGSAGTGSAGAGSGAGSAGAGSAGAGSASGAVSARAMADAVEVIATFVAGFEPGLYSCDDAASLVASFTRAERLCAAGKTLAANRVAASNRHDLTGHASPAHWLAGVTGESVGEADSLLRLGRALENQHEVEDAYRKGVLSPTGAKLVAGAVKVNPGSEHELLKGARSDTLRQLKDRCLRAKAQGRSRQDADRHAEEVRRSRSCRTWTDNEDGSFRLDARLTPDAGALLVASLTAEANRVFDRARKSGVEESPDNYRADALVALVTGRGIIGPSGSDAGSDATTTTTVTAGDAERDGDTTSDPTGVSPDLGPGGGRENRRGTAGGPGPRFPDPKATVFVRVDLDALRRGSVADGEICEIPGVGPVPVATARRLMGDALTELVITNGVDVTTICRLGRWIPAPLNSALIERDRTCVVPGCDVAEGLERDHWGIDFAAGGTVSLENLARLCHRHHYLRTHRGWVLGGGPGRWTWEAPTGAGPPGHNPGHSGDSGDSDRPGEPGTTGTTGEPRGPDDPVTPVGFGAVHPPGSPDLNPPVRPHRRTSPPEDRSDNDLRLFSADVFEG